MAILFLRIPSSTSSSSSARRSTRQGGSRCRYAVRVAGEPTDSSDGMVGRGGRDAAVATMNEASFIEPPAGCVGRHQEGSISTPLTPPPTPSSLHAASTTPQPSQGLPSVHQGIITTLYHRPPASCCLYTRGSQQHSTTARVPPLCAACSPVRRVRERGGERGEEGLPWAAVVSGGWS